TISGDTSWAANDYVGTCIGTYGLDTLIGGDLVYRVVLESDATVKVDVARGDDATYQPGIIVRRTCESDLPEDEVVCINSNSSGVATTKEMALPAGEWFVIVDGKWSTGGPFTMTITGSNFRPPAAGCAL